MARARTFPGEIALKRPAQESPIEGSEYQDDADVHHQPFPKPVSEEGDVYADDDGDHRQHVEHENCLSCHVGTLARPRTAPPVAAPSVSAAEWRIEGGHEGGI